MEKLVRKVYFLDQCRSGRSGETCRRCAAQSRWAKRATSKALRRAAREALAAELFEA